MTVLAAVNVNPTPPALIDSCRTGKLLSLNWTRLYTRTIVQTSEYLIRANRKVITRKHMNEIAIPLLPW
jgi:hypothetical protein